MGEEAGLPLPKVTYHGFLTWKKGTIDREEKGYSIGKKKKNQQACHSNLIFSLVFVCLRKEEKVKSSIAKTNYVLSREKKYISSIVWTMVLFLYFNKNLDIRSLLPTPTLILTPLYEMW